MFGIKSQKFILFHKDQVNFRAKIKGTNFYNIIIFNNFEVKIQLMIQEKYICTEGKQIK